jgi:hypothetical protein
MRRQDKEIQSRPSTMTSFEPLAQLSAWRPRHLINTTNLVLRAICDCPTIGGIRDVSFVMRFDLNRLPSN